MIFDAHCPQKYLQSKACHKINVHPWANEQTSIHGVGHDGQANTMLELSDLICLHAIHKKYENNIPRIMQYEWK
jgi:hypothetical protein